MKCMLIAVIVFTAAFAQAATRKATFALTATNVIDRGATSAVNSTCTVLMVNQSSYDQVYTITLSADSGSDGDSSGGVTASGTTGTISANSSATATFTYNSLAADTASLSQTVTCAGVIQVQDSTNPGFITSTVTLSYFSESDQAASMGATNTVRGVSQILFYEKTFNVNGGRPF